MRRYSPLDQLSDQYLREVIKKSTIVEFSAGDLLFDKSHSLDFYYYLLKGKLSAKKGTFFSKTLRAKSKRSLHPLNASIPDGTSVKAATNGHLLLVEPELLDRALAWNESNSQSEAKTTPKLDKAALATEKFDEDYFNWMTSLLEFPLFLSLPPANITELFEKFERTEVQKGQVVIRENDEGDYFYLLISGSASVVVGDDQTKVATLRPGAYFGEEALVSDIVRSASVIMEEKGCLARLDKVSFQQLLHNSLVHYISKKAYLEKLRDPEHQGVLLDIRSLTEFEHIPMPDCQHIPLNELRDRLAELDKSATYYLTEDGGQRSDIAAHILSQHQFEVFVLKN